MPGLINIINLYKLHMHALLQTCKMPHLWADALNMPCNLPMLLQARLHVDAPRCSTCGNSLSVSEQQIAEQQDGRCGSCQKLYQVTGMVVLALTSPA